MKIKKKGIALLLVLMIFSIAFIFGSGMTHNEVTAKVSQLVVKDTSSTVIDSILLILLAGLAIVLMSILGNLVRSHHLGLHFHQPRPTIIETPEQIIEEDEALKEKIDTLVNEVDAMDKISAGIKQTKTLEQHKELIQEHTEEKQDLVSKHVDAIHAFAKNLILKQTITQENSSEDQPSPSQSDF
ncbi:hypothetical protein HN419_06300 [Candidatus Woesearchaeota archaeon]|nr:hypothetical protein [Candidatus Woesearchaeota archaeon]MBT3538106.1 hypothetical protein [Candidatus Woesearchaeota archaeon]MBT4697535.1 hypothetical protein [Candidatus Woesearchaeota archaeon]MBT4717382.1 hypothetical protein [Candidatus Woesearchaeota archaeon]MBT7105775.1 hypothetical protein [Candidatus Woesearchaeota archaeon]